MTIDNILEILEKHKLHIPSNVFYELKADIVNFDEPTTKNDKVDCEHTDCNNCVNHKYCDYEPTTKNDLGVDCISRADALRVAKNEYLRGWHNALCEALNEKYSIHCEEGNFHVIQEETITGLGLSMNCALGKDVESYMSTMPSVTPQEPRKGHWIVQPSNKEQDERDFIWWKCSECGQVIFSETEKDRKEFHAFCGRCGADMREVEE